GWIFSLGLKSDGSIVGWGGNARGQCDAPTPNENFIALACGGYHSLGLKSDGSIVAWGSNDDGQCNVPSPNADFIALEAAGYRSYGLKSEGVIVRWGTSYGTVPEPNIGFTAISGGSSHDLAIRGTWPSFCDGAQISNLSHPTQQGAEEASACIDGDRAYEITERFVGDGRVLAGVGFWFAMPDGVPAEPGFRVRIYVTGAGGCPDGDPIFDASCNVVEIGNGSGTAEDPVEYFCDFSDNGYEGLRKLSGLEYSISIQNTNCPGEGEGASWASGEGDGVLGCLRGYDVPSWTPLQDVGVVDDRAFYLCNEDVTYFCADAGVSDLAPPAPLGIVGASECINGSGPVEVTERFQGDDRTLTGIGFWMVWLDETPPANPRFSVRIYPTGADGCPEGFPIFYADCDVVEVGPGNGTIFNPIEYFCDFSDNGYGSFDKVTGLEYSISIQNTNCPGPGERAYWINGVGDEVYGCLRSYNNPYWTPTDVDRAMYLCNEESLPSSTGEATTTVSAKILLGRPSPNPSRGRIDYFVTLSTKTHVRVTILDAMGRVVSRPVVGVLPAGIHNYTWPSSKSREGDIPNGTYFLVLKSDQEIFTRKFSIIR
ncbi:MAG: T9SS type A sorting domain-containing protein, partial [Candidatus Latescibacteria bacterium]|nr:T9SS type A sorting domain-containing protein [Candidatus Latescibacterota bacterium]